MFAVDANCPCTFREAVNFGERIGCVAPDMLILHYTGMASCDAAIDWLCREESGVSCHYVVCEEGKITQLVPEAKRAWHAGLSSWQDNTDINSRSVGIEICNPGHEGGLPDFPAKQIDAVIELSIDIIARNKIAPRHVLAHSDVAPGRKIDPGEKFPWQKLAENNVGLWVPPKAGPQGVVFQFGENGEPIAALQAMLALYGYGVEISGNFDRQTQMCVSSFQRHFRPSLVDGVADGETIATLEALIQKL